MNMAPTTPGVTSRRPHWPREVVTVGEWAASRFVRLHRITSTQRDRCSRPGTGSTASEPLLSEGFEDAVATREEVASLWAQEHTSGAVALREGKVVGSS